MSIHATRPVWTCLSLLALVVGCGKPAAEFPDAYDVSGRVTLDGKPLENGVIGFQSEGSDGANYRLDASGKFPAGLKFPVGTYQVRVEGEPIPEGDGGDPTSEQTQQVPPEYSQFETSGLTVEVKAETNDFTLEL